MDRQNKIIELRWQQYELRRRVEKEFELAMKLGPLALDVLNITNDIVVESQPPVVE